MGFGDWYLVVVPILIRTGMLGFWVAAIVTHRVPEIESGRIEIRFHIVAETVTGLVLIAGGLAALIDPSAGWAIALSAVCLGMLMYTLFVSPGYYAELQEWPLVWGFVVVWALTIPAVVFRSLAHEQRRRSTLRHVATTVGGRVGCPLRPLAD